MDAQALLQQFQGITAGGAAALGASRGGALDSLGDLSKALQASNYQTDVSTLEGGGALGMQSLDTAMKTTVQENKHFTLFNRLQQTKATNIVDEYVRQSSVGGFLGGSTNTQMGVVRAAQGEYEREVGFVKFLMCLRQVGFILNIGKNITDATAVEERNGALQLLTDANYLLYHGNSDVSPAEFDGIFHQIDAAILAGKQDGACVVDMRAQPLNTVEPFSQVNVAVSGYGSWGRSSDVFLPNSVQNDLNQGLDPAFRWMPNGNNTPVIGGQVDGIRLTNGILRTSMDTFIQDEQNPMVYPFEVNNAATAAANVAFLPATLAVDGTHTDPSSYFTTPQAGNYYYAVAGIGAQGQGLSASIQSGTIAVAGGSAPVLTISQSASGSESGYAIYRSRQNGTNATNDFRLVTTIPKTGATTTYTDFNRDIPGTVRVPLLNLDPGADAIGWRQFQPMIKIPLPFGVGSVPVISWFQFLFGYLRVTKPKHQGYIKNILPSQAKWRPFSQ